MAPSDWALSEGAELVPVAGVRAAAVDSEGEEVRVQTLWMGRKAESSSVLRQCRFASLQERQLNCCFRWRQRRRMSLSGCVRRAPECLGYTLFEHTIVEHIRTKVILYNNCLYYDCQSYSQANTDIT